MRFSDGEKCTDTIDNPIGQVAKHLWVAHVVSLNDISEEESIEVFPVQLPTQGRIDSEDGREATFLLISLPRILHEEAITAALLVARRVAADEVFAEGERKQFPTEGPPPEDCTYLL